MAEGTNCILVKTCSEIALKSDHVRRYFTKKLISNIRFSLKAEAVKIETIARGGGRLYLFTPNPKKAARILQNVPGVHAIAFSSRHSWKEYEDVEAAVLAEAKNSLKKGDSFALRVRREKPVPISSKEFENRIGTAVLASIPGLKVKLKNPDKEIFVEVRTKDLFVYGENIPCLRGLPLGVEGNASFLFAGKKDELLAAFLLMFRGCNIYPVAKRFSPKLKAHINKLKKFNAGRNFIFTELKNLPSLVEEREIQAIGTADSGVKAKDFAAYKKFDSNQTVNVLRPLLLYPKKLLKEKEW